jgi:hypothetical protein
MNGAALRMDGSLIFGFSCLFGLSGSVGADETGNRPILDCPVQIVDRPMILR